MVQTVLSLRLRRGHCRQTRNRHINRLRTVPGRLSIQNLDRTMTMSKDRRLSANSAKVGRRCLLSRSVWICFLKIRLPSLRLDQLNDYSIQDLLALKQTLDAQIKRAGSYAQSIQAKRDSLSKEIKANNKLIEELVQNAQAAKGMHPVMIHSPQLAFTNAKCFFDSRQSDSTNQVEHFQPEINS
jgi:hypothetical protein